MRYSVAFLFLFLLPMQVHAQRVAPDTTGGRQLVDVLYADAFNRSRAASGEEIVQLSGNVRMRQDSTYLFAQRVTQYPDRREYLFRGAVRIIERGDTLDADRVRYDAVSKIGFATGNVRLTDGDVVVTAPSGEYFVRDEQIRFRETVQLVDSTAVLRSVRGIYFTEAKRAEFDGDVRLVQEHTTLDADSVTHFREADVTLARGNVVVEQYGDGSETAAPDSTQRALLFGPTARHENQRGYSRFDGGASLIRLHTDSLGVTDTLLVKAQVLESSRADTLDRLTAVGKVEFWQRRLAAVADSVVYDRLPADSTAADSDARRDEDLRLFRVPIAWLDAAQVTGDTLRLSLLDGRPDTLFVQQNAFVAQFDSALQRIQQLKGTTLLGLFRGDSLRYLRLTPASEAVFFAAAEDGNTLGQAVDVSADTVQFWLSNGEVEKIVASRDAEGTVYDAAIVPPELKLSGLNWLPLQRPRREALITPAMLARLEQRRVPTQ